MEKFLICGTGKKGDPDRESPALSLVEEMELGIWGSQSSWGSRGRAPERRGLHRVVTGSSTSKILEARKRTAGEKERDNAQRTHRARNSACSKQLEQKVSQQGTLRVLLHYWRINTALVSAKQASEKEPKLKPLLINLTVSQDKTQGYLLTYKSTQNQGLGV